MKCGLLDIPCQAEAAFWGLVNLVPWWAWLAAALAGLLVAYKLGGWPLVAALCFGYGIIWGRHKDDQTPHENVSGPYAETTKRRRTYNADTGRWE